MHQGFFCCPHHPAFLLSLLPKPLCSYCAFFPAVVALAFLKRSVLAGLKPCTAAFLGFCLPPWGCSELQHSRAFRSGTVLPGWCEHHHGVLQTSCGFPDEGFPICMSSDADALPPNPCKGTSITSNYSPTEGTVTLTRNPTDVSSAWGLSAGAVCAQGHCHKFRSSGITEDEQNTHRLSSLLAPEPLSKHKLGL